MSDRSANPLCGGYLIRLYLNLTVPSGVPWPGARPAGVATTLREGGCVEGIDLRSTLSVERQMETRSGYRRCSVLLEYPEGRSCVPIGTVAYRAGSLLQPT